MPYFDSHAHLFDPLLFPDLEGILARAKDAKVEKIVAILTDEGEIPLAKEAQLRHQGLYLAAALTPHDVEEKGEPFFEKVAQMAEEGALVAIGETGLDFFSVSAPREVQEAFLVRHLHLAARHQLPVLFHCRNAFSRLFSIVDAQLPLGSKAVVHCFTGTQEEAFAALQRGWYLSFSGIVTFKKSEELRKIVKATPLSQMLVETDAPFLAPQSRRGKRNEPSFVLETVAVIAEEKGMTAEEVTEAIWQNGEEVFGSW